MLFSNGKSPCALTHRISRHYACGPHRRPELGRHRKWRALSVALHAACTHEIGEVWRAQCEVLADIHGLDQLQNTQNECMSV
jgi:hypothetical protein